MKFFIFFLMITSGSAFSQWIPEDNHAMDRLLEKAEQDPNVTQVISQIETQHNVKCEKKLLTILPDLSRSITVKGKCEGQKKLNYKATLKFKSTSKETTFSLKSYKVIF